MVSAISESIRVTVDVEYIPDERRPMGGEHFFVYKIMITNESASKVQLQRRFWDIREGTGKRRLVEGEGVVGKQPILEPGESFFYASGCDLEYEMGSMQGHYTFLKLNDQQLFRVDIPKFQLNTTFVLS